MAISPFPVVQYCLDNDSIFERMFIKAVRNGLKENEHVGYCIGNDSVGRGKAKVSWLKKFRELEKKNTKYTRKVKKQNTKQSTKQVQSPKDSDGQPKAALKEGRKYRNLCIDIAKLNNWKIETEATRLYCVDNSGDEVVGHEFQKGDKNGAWNQFYQILTEQSIF